MTASRSDADPLFTGVGELCAASVRQAHCDGAAVAVLTRRAHTRELVYATDTMAARLDELQYTLGEGPCLDAYLENTPQFHPHLDSATHTSQWPTFATEVTRLGVHSLFAFPIPGPRRPGGPSGVLELYRRAAGDLTHIQCEATVDAAATIAARLRTNWDEHLTHFDTPEQAIDAAATIGAQLDAPADPFTRSQVHVAAGMLATRLHVHPDDAVDRLRAHAYATGRRLSTIAADVIAHRLTLHDQPEPPHPHQ